MVNFRNYFMINYFHFYVLCQKNQHDAINNKYLNVELSGIWIHVDFHSIVVIFLKFWVSYQYFGDKYRIDFSYQFKISLMKNDNLFWPNTSYTQNGEPSHKCLNWKTKYVNIVTSKWSQVWLLTLRYVLL